MVYVVLGIIHRNGYLASSPKENYPNGSAKSNDDVKETFAEWYREQTFSATLAGFSITALVFVLGLEELSNIQRMVDFFVIGFILEMLSFLSYKHMIKQGYDYFGTVFQFTGLLAMYSGFFIFIIRQSMFNEIMFFAFIGGYVVFFVLALKQLGSYITMFKI